MKHNTTHHVYNFGVDPPIDLQVTSEFALNFWQILDFSPQKILNVGVPR